MTAQAFTGRMISSDILRDFLIADVKSPTSMFYMRNIQPFFGTTKREDPAEMIPINNIIARAMCEKFIPLGHGQVICLNVPGGRITAAYPIMHGELPLERPERIVMIRQLLKDNTLDERIYLPSWYRNEYGGIPLKMGGIQKQFVMCCATPWIKKNNPKASFREIFHCIEEDYHFELRYDRFGL